MKILCFCTSIAAKIANCYFKDYGIWKRQRKSPVIAWKDPTQDVDSKLFEQGQLQSVATDYLNCGQLNSAGNIELKDCTEYTTAFAICKLGTNDWQNN